MGRIESRLGYLNLILCELVGSFLFIMFVLWIVGPGRYISAVLGIMWIVSGTVWWHMHNRKLGFWFRGFAPTMKLLLVPACMVSVGIVLSAYYLDINHVPKAWLIQTPQYIVWAILQQLWLQGYVFQRVELLLPSRILQIGLTSVLFAVVHLPNWKLAIIALVGGSILTLVFQWYRNVLAVGLLHALTGITVHYFSLSDFNVGICYLRGQNGPFLSLF